MAGQSVQLADLMALGISYRRLDCWTTKGFLRAAAPHPGSGGQRSWLPGEAAIAETMLLLTAAGVAPSKAHDAARNGGWLSDRVRVVIDPRPAAQAA